MLCSSNKLRMKEWICEGRIYFSFCGPDFKCYIFLLEYNCFTILYSFLQFSEVYQSYVYIYILPLESPFHNHIPPPHLGGHPAELPVLYNRLSLAFYFTYGNTM